MIIRRIRIITEILDAKGIKRFKIWLGPELYLLTRDFKDIELIFGSTKLIEKAREYKYLKSWL